MEKTKSKFCRKGDGEIWWIVVLIIIWFAILGGIALVKLVFGGEYEGIVKYDDCRQTITIQEGDFQTYFKKFTCAYVKTKSGKIMSGVCVHTDSDSSLLSSSHSCATAYVYEKIPDPACVNNLKDGVFYPYLGYNDNCYTTPQGGEAYIDPASLTVPTSSFSKADSGTSSGISDSLPTQIGQCSKTTISKIGTRLTDGNTGQDIAGSGSAISYSNGGYQVSYSTIPGTEDSAVGDMVNLCLVSIPTDCPAGDNRGRVYSALNERTGHAWQASDSEHSCGGA